jgi:hypothetical protein
MKTFKTLFLFGMLTLLTPYITFAQEDDGPEKGGGKRKEKIQQFKIAYFTEELKLTVAESEKFWPLYNEMEDKIKANRKDIKKVADEIAKNQDNYSDEEYKKQVNKIFDLEAAQATIKKEYYAKIAEAIGYKKATKMLKIEKEFKQKLLKELKKRKDQRPPHPGPPPQGPPPRGR